MRVKRLVCILATFSSAACAQGTLELSLSRAVEIALAPQGSTRVALAGESIALAEERKTEAKQAFYPVVDGSMTSRSQTANLKSFGFNFNFPTIPGIGSFSIPTFVGPFTVIDARASAQVPVIDFAMIARLKTSRSGLKGAQAELDATRNQVSEAVARAYLTGLRTDAALEAARANVELSQALVDLATSQKDAGTGTGIDVTRARVQLADNQQKLLVAENERRRAALGLLRAMGLDLGTEVRFTDKLRFDVVDIAAAESALAKARDSRAELRAQKEHEETARLTYNSIRAESLPSVAAFGDYGDIGQDFGAMRATRTIGATIKIPLFDSRRNGRREESLVQYRQEKIRTADLQAQIEMEVRLAIDSLRSAQSQVQTAQDGLALAQNELDQARRRFQAGVTSSIEVTDAQTRLDRARDNQVAALYNYNLARLDLASSTGTISEYVNP